MKKKVANQKNPTNKTKAFEGSKTNKPETVKNMTSAEIKHLIEDLQTHQVELEAQNEELSVMQDALESARDKYQDLYDFSPVAYLTHGEGDIIRDVNLTGSSLLGIDRSHMTGLSFRKLIHKEDQDVYHLNQQKLVDTGERQAYELRMIKKDGSEFHAGIECMVIRNDRDTIGQIRMVIMDVSSRVKAESELKRHFEELRAVNDELTRFNRAAVDRELRMIELKKEVNELCSRLGQARRYHLDFEEKNHESR